MSDGPEAAGWFQVPSITCGYQPLHPALLQAWLKPVQKRLRLVAAPESGCYVSIIEPFSCSSGTLFVPRKAILLILWFFFFPPLAFSAAQFSAFPKDVSILTIPSTFQTLKHMVFLIMYLPSFLRPHHGGRPLSAPPPPRSLFKASSPVSWWCGEGLTCEWFLPSPRKASDWFSKP